MPPDTSEPDPSGQPESAKTEPLACVSCRARKLKCDRTKPACTRCVKVSNECVYPESRRKPNFKRRNVKELEARLGKYLDNQQLYCNHEPRVADDVSQLKLKIISRRSIRILQGRRQTMGVQLSHRRRMSTSLIWTLPLDWVTQLTICLIPIFRLSHHPTSSRIHKRAPRF